MKGVVLNVLFVLASGLLLCCAEPQAFHVISAGAVFASSTKQDTHIHVIPIGTFVVGREKVQGEEAADGMLHITFPLVGWIEASVCEKIDTVDTKHMCSGEKRRTGRAFLAGSNILGSCIKSQYSNWVNQWPVGGSKIGALVGGNLGAEIVPLSIADLFFINGGQMDDLTRFSNSASTDTKSRDSFEAGRAACIRGNTAMTDKKISEIHGQPSGRFEYVGDLAFAFALPASLGQVGRTEAPEWSPAGGPRKAVYEGLRNAVEKLKPGIADLSFASRGLSGRETAQVSHLDMERGLASSSFFVSSADRKKKYVQHRLWFASSVDDVIVGQFSCSLLAHEDEGGQGCMNVAMRLSRSLVKPEGNNPGIRVEARGKSHLKSNHASVVYRMSVTLHPERHIVANTVACIALVCEPEHSHGSDHANATASSTAGDAYHLSGRRPFRHHSTSDAVVCRGGRKATVIIAVEKEDNLETARTWQDANRRATVLKGLEATCWKRIDAALDKDPVLLQRRHMDYTRERMLRVSFPASLSVRPEVPMFQYGKYLLLSGANGAAMNLQGLWADGKQSTWNGDYHLNINLQMMYWAADAVGLGAETMIPLVTFLRRLREQGEKTAMQLYGYPGWVAHGFTDGYMRAGIGGDIKWAYCITCGAWAALSLWDHVAYAPAASPGYTKALEELLTSFQGIAKFFSAYLVDVKGVLNTGPSTSPENSYSLGKGVGSTRLAMSPALDLSVLRNIAEAYEYAVASLPDSDPRKKPHSISAQGFAAKVRQLPNGGLPRVSERTGLVQEYPAPMGQVSEEADETVDIGHRHFSSMHWLYPGLGLPGARDKPHGLDAGLYTAAEKTLTAKNKDGGGHSSWSSSWEACLWARLGRGDDALRALDRILRTYSTPHYMSLHPKLIPRGAKHCLTCYRERNGNPTRVGDDGTYPRARAGATIRRAMTTAEEGIFQLDGNLGFMAAVVEMLMQSHVPGVLWLLPALPSEWSRSEGGMEGLRARGDVLVSVAWATGGAIKQATIAFGSQHAWNHGKSYLVNAPGIDKLSSKTSPDSCASITQGADRLEVNFGGSFPCKLIFS